MTSKERAGRHAARYVEAGMRVGLGTGSTVHWTVVELGVRALGITCVATSLRTEELARSVGLTLVSPDQAGHLDIAIDGADEVDPSGNVTKGGGGALTREKIVAEMAPRFVIVVDETKLVPALGPFGTPLEVLDFAPGVVAARVEALGARKVTRRAERSDNGNLVLDAQFGTIADPAALAAELAVIPGLVEHGLFLASTVERVVVAGADDVRDLRVGAEPIR
ncbi:MAG: ribose-5-phosphate isomerase RpiA [Acidimicrobiia bacterium]|nr:ribose-5-phosphate isomerase RpiA [Acidimicrobiia bacterium]